MIDSPWLPLVYQYVVGGAVFLLAIVIAVRKKAVSFSFRQDRRMLFQLILGFLFYFVLHLVWIIIILS